MYIYCIYTTLVLALPKTRRHTKESVDKFEDYDRRIGWRMQLGYCIFNYTNMKNCDGDGCMFNGEDAFPRTWEIRLIEKE